MWAWRVSYVSFNAQADYLVAQLSRALGHIIQARSAGPDRYPPGGRGPGLVLLRLCAALQLTKETVRAISADPQAYSQMDRLLALPWR